MTVFLMMLLVIGLGGLTLFRTNFLLVLMGVELLFFGINLTFAWSSVLLDDLMGQLFFLYVLTVAGAESGVGLAILVSYYRLRGEIWLDLVNKLKG
jgi:NADH:ubiquinone oxidoreductase subunit K